MLRTIVRIVVLAIASPVAAGTCVAPDWPSTATLRVAPSGYVLDIGPPVVGLLGPVEVTRVGSTITVVGQGVDTCGIGVPPPPRFLVAELGNLPDGQYTVGVAVAFDPLGTLTERFQLSIGSVPVDATRPSGLLLMLSLVLVLGLSRLRPRIPTAAT